MSGGRRYAYIASILFARLQLISTSSIHHVFFQLERFSYFVTASCDTKYYSHAVRSKKCMKTIAGLLKSRKRYEIMKFAPCRFALHGLVFQKFGEARASFVLTIAKAAALPAYGDE